MPGARQSRYVPGRFTSVQYNQSMQRFSAVFVCAFLLIAAIANAVAGEADWPYWRGPNADGMARGDAPLHWSDKEHVAWKATVPGRGFSSPVVWGDRIFLT